MRFYYITWVDYEGMNRQQLFRNKKDAAKAHAKLNRDEEEGGESYISDIQPIVLEKLNKDSIVKFVNNIT